MKKWMAFLTGILLALVLAVSVHTVSSIHSEPNADRAVSWSTAALFGVAGAGAGVVTAILLYRKCQEP